MTDELMTRLQREARDAYAWSNEPGYRYGAHSHAYTKILYCVAGSIDFVVEPEGRIIGLRAGDRMELAAGTVHSARVGRDGVTCVEGKKAEEDR
ncbi:MAG: cupin [Chloroflexi bacterium]|nr:MAG: cupin [Chloroflexota bacterium]